MRKPTIAVLVAALFAVLLLVHVATGPYRTLASIRTAIADDDASALAAHVDFPALRASLKDQLRDRLARGYGDRASGSTVGLLALGAAGHAVDGAVEVMVTPLGLGALMQGRMMWQGARDAFDPPPAADDASTATATGPLDTAEHRFESASRFTATFPDEDGRPVVLVLSRQGLDWRLTDIRLPRAGEG